MRNINLAVVDHDKSPYSQKLISKIVASGYFRLTGYNASFKEAFGLIESDKADLILEIPHDFERNLIRDDREKLFVAVNAINGTKASLGGSYLGSIIGISMRISGCSWSHRRGSVSSRSSTWWLPTGSTRF